MPDPSGSLDCLQPSDNKGQSGQQKGEENVRAVRAYVDSLKLRREGLPTYQGKPNWSAIALACGFDRGVWHNNPTARSVIEQAVETDEIGLATKVEIADGREAHKQKQLDRSERRVQELEERLAIKSEEVETLKRNINELETKLRLYVTFEEVMATTGRRLIP